MGDFHRFDVIAAIVARLGRQVSFKANPAVGHLAGRAQAPNRDVHGSAASVALNPDRRDFALGGAHGVDPRIAASARQSDGPKSTVTLSGS